MGFRSYLKDAKAIKSKTKYKIPAKKDNSSTTLKSLLKCQWGYKDQTSTFEDMWQKALIETKNKIICPFTGENLTHYQDGQMSFWVSCFLHILSKKQYPLWKLNPHNIIIAYPLFHSIVDQGRLSDRLQYPNWKWDKWDKLVESHKKEYAEWLKLNT